MSEGARQMSKEDKETKVYALGLKDGRSSGRNEALQEIKKLIQVIKKLKKENEEYKKLLEWRRYVETNEQRRMV